MNFTNVLNIENPALDFRITVFIYFITLIEVIFLIFTIIVLRTSGTVLEWTIGK